MFRSMCNIFVYIVVRVAGICIKKKKRTREFSKPNKIPNEKLCPQMMR